MEEKIVCFRNALAQKLIIGKLNCMMITTTLTLNPVTYWGGGFVLSEVEGKPNHDTITDTQCQYRPHLQECSNLRWLRPRSSGGERRRARGRPHAGSHRQWHWRRAGCKGRRRRRRLCHHFCLCVKIDKICTPHMIIGLQYSFSWNDESHLSICASVGMWSRPTTLSSSSCMARCASGLMDRR